MLWLGLCFSFSDKLLILGQENLSAKLIRGLTTLLLLLSSPAVLSLSLLQAEDVGGWVFPPWLDAAITSGHSRARDPSGISPCKQLPASSAHPILEEVSRGCRAHSYQPHSRAICL